MESLKETRRQITTATVGILTVFSLGVTGFSIIEELSITQALWLTTMTLTTVGYGDTYAETSLGQYFTIFLVLVGFGVVAYGLQAIATFLVSPEISDLREKKRTLKIIRQLDNHYIICGSGELVDQTIAHLWQSVQMRIAFYNEELYGPIDNFLDGIFGDDELGHYPRIRAVVRRAYLAVTRPFTRVGTLLDLIVVITEDPTYAKSLREGGFFVIEGSATGEETLKNAGVERANAIMVTLPDDTETLLTVLTARNLNPSLYITAATQEEDLLDKIWRVGANNVVRPFDLAGKFLNNITLRPAVYDFYSGILFDHTLDMQTTQVSLVEGSQWIGKRIHELNLRETYDGCVIGILGQNAEFIVAPSDTYILSAGEDVIVVAPTSAITEIKSRARVGALHLENIKWSKPHDVMEAFRVDRRHTPDQAERIVKEMEKHFVVCGNDEVARSAILQLAPDRPFVIVCDDDDYIEELVDRGFLVIKGDPTRDSTLLRAGADRALAVMISMEDEADTVLTVISARSLSKHLLITATANADENIRKIHRAGADRVVSPFSIAAQFVLLSTTRPTVATFFQQTLYNRQVGVETTELYMQDNSPWIGKTIGGLRLDRLFRASVIAVRHRTGKFLYAPQADYEIKEYEVLVIVTPMIHADELRTAAHGSDSKRPDTLRRASVIQTTVRSNPLFD